MGNVHTHVMRYNRNDKIQYTLIECYSFAADTLIPFTKHFAFAHVMLPRTWGGHAWRVIEGGTSMHM